MKIARPRMFLAGLGLSGAIILLDQASKIWMFRVLLVDGQELALTPFFSLVKRHNLGISFSFLSTDHPLGPWLLSALALAIASVLVIWLARTSDRLPAIGLGLIIGGALGNVIDRVVVGAVQDFLLFHWREWAWPAFNLADSAITIGVGLLLLDGLAIRGRKTRAAKPD